MMITTTVQMFEAVLTELRKQKTTSLTPTEFNYFCAQAHLEYVKNRYVDFDLHQKHIDDLQKIIVLTDGVGGNPQPLNLQNANCAVGEEFFVLPTYAANSVTDKKFFLLDVQFGFNCTDANEQSTGIVYKPARFLANDTHRANNYYQKPKDSANRYYYYQMKDGIRKLGGQTKATKAIVKFLRYPVIPSLNDNGTQLVAPEFEPRINSEIVNFIVSAYLENTMSQRQGTFAQNNNSIFNAVTPQLNSK